MRAWSDGGQVSTGMIVLLVARPEMQFQGGHLPSARTFDHFHPKQSLPIVLPLCLATQTVIVYCTGDTCEDSKFSVRLLRALELRGASGLALCAVKFDCGCGTGEVYACRKLFENFLLTMISLWLAFSSRARLCWRHTLLGSR